MARRVDIVKEYILKEIGLLKSEEWIIKNLCPTAHRYNINKLGIHLNKNECLTSTCKDCWNREV